MTTVHLILMVFSFVCFTLAAILSPQPYYPRLVAIGLAFWTAAILLTKVPM